MSLTVLYKKYIGDAPAVDYDSVSKFTKGTKEYKNDYAKWLKQQVNGIGTTYGIKPVAMPEKPTPIPTHEPKIETHKKTNTYTN